MMIGRYSQKFPMHLLSRWGAEKGNPASPLAGESILTNHDEVGHETRALVKVG
jgi:hypothetical protein